MPNTTNFNWPTPADTDLVKDGAAAIRNLGNGVDTSFLDLKGGTTDQVLAKNSNTDLDFKWVAQDDSNAIQNALLTTTGDTIYASAASTPARLGLGTAGQVLRVNSGATAPEWATPAATGFVGCALYKSGNQSIANATTTVVTWDSEDFDTDGFHSTVTNTERITIPAGKGGKYLIVWIIQFPANGNGQRSASLRKNGSGFLNYTNVPANANAEIKMFGSFIADVVATDYFDITVFQDSSASQNVVGTTGYSAFQVQYLGA